MRLGQVLYFGLIVAIGAKTYSAHNIAGSIVKLCVYACLWVGDGCCYTDGMSIGKKDYDETKRIAFYL